MAPILHGHTYVDKIKFLIVHFVENITANSIINRDFKRGDLLHIALSNSKSMIFEFNENGISSSSASSHLNWTNFLCISLSALPYRFEDLDEILETTKVMDIWAAERYDWIAM